MKKLIFFIVLAMALSVTVFSAQGTESVDPDKPIILKPGNTGDKNDDRVKMPAKPIYAYYDGEVIRFDMVAMVGVCDLIVTNQDGTDTFSATIADLCAGVIIGGNVIDIELVLPDGRIFIAEL